jgi:hypothetical protein
LREISRVSRTDAIPLREADVLLDRALFLLLVLIQRRGPPGMGELRGCCAGLRTI